MQVPAQTVMEVQGWRGTLVHMGLSMPSTRGLLACVVTGTVLYALALPSHSFDRDGRMRPFRLLSAEPSAVLFKHFAAIPIATGLIIFSVT